MLLDSREQYNTKPTLSVQATQNINLYPLSFTDEAHEATVAIAEQFDRFLMEQDKAPAARGVNFRHYEAEGGVLLYLQP